MKKEEVFEDLRVRIINGDLPPGQWLVERDLSEMYRISRTPVREKLRKMANLGIVEFEPSKGYQVKKLRVEEIIEIFNAREAVEGESARLACLARNSAFLKRLEELRIQLESVDILSESARGVEIGKQIHDLIMDTANNRFLSEFYQKLTNLAALARNMSKNSPKIESHSKDDHLNIVKALADGDAEKCEKYMREHIRSTCRALVNNYLNLPGSIVLQ